MSALARHMAKYASHHRHPVNRAIHVVGIPMIVASLVLLLAMVRIPAPVPLSLAMVVTVPVVAWYVVLDRPIGAVTSLAVLLVLGVAEWAVAAVGADALLPWAVGAHVASWVAQFLGHGVWEKRRPALFDNLLQSLIAPLFLVAEAAFAMGLRPELRQQVEAA